MLRHRKRTLLLFIVAALLLYRLRRSNSPKSRRSLSILDHIRRQDSLSSIPHSCFTNLNKRNVRRAIVVHFPVSRSELYFPELKWLYLSWIETLERQPLDWQTDLLIYALPSPLLDELGCYQTERRDSKGNCYRLDYKSIWDKANENDDIYRFIQIHVPAWCRHLDSLGILLDQSDRLFSYDYILRTDLDVFLAPDFADYIPFDCSFQIGLGGYSMDYTVNKLSRIARTLNLLNANMTHVGSSWYAPPQQAVLVARLALWLSVWLTQNEFTPVEKNQRLSILSWPQWYIGVVSMYASHLAINHLAARGQMNLIQKPYLIDYSCTTNTSFHDVEIIHIHAWHTSDMFSKFLFKNGTYDQLLQNRTVWNTNYSMDFILRMAWQSHQLTGQELFQRLKRRSQ